MKIYISGPITGLLKDEVERNFSNAIDQVRMMFPNAEIINPLWICSGMPFTEWKDFMQICLKMLAECDAIYMMKGWANSKGCLTEYYFAAGSNITIYTFDDYENCK